MIEFKKDPYTLVFYAVSIVAATALLYKGVLHWDQVTPYFAGLLIPSVLGRKAAP